MPKTVEKIISLQNARVKEVVKLSKRAVRDERRSTVVEGVREISRALQNGITPVEAYLCPGLVKAEDRTLMTQIISQLEQSPSTRCFEVTPEVFARLAYREERDGLLIVIPYLEHHLARLPLTSCPFFCVIEGVEKPGNLGAILRTADAAGVDGVIVCAGNTDLHNPNVIRASLGTLFTVPVAEAPTPETIAWLRANGMTIVAATPAASNFYTKVNLTRPLAIVLGSEATGLGVEWLAAADQTVTIPMFGAADSLNLATATALLLYEVVRQRGATTAQTTN